MKKCRKIETAKTLLIVVLSISAVLLGVQEGVLGSVLVSSAMSNFSDDSETTTSASEQFNNVAYELPLYAVVTNSDGGHYGIKYNTSEIASLYDISGNLFGEALGSSDIVLATDDQTFQNAISSESIFLDYVNPVYISLLSSWLYTDLSENISEIEVRQLCISAEDGSVYLYIRDNLSGNIYRAETAVSYSSLMSVISEYKANSASFLFEIDALSNSLDLYQFILPEVSGYNVVSYYQPLSDDENTVSSVLQYFGISSYINSRYAESDGTIVFVESDYTLRLNIADGTVLVRYPIQSSDEADLADCVSNVYGIINDTIKKYCGEADIHISDIQAESGRYEFYFKYYINSSEIYLTDGYAARAVIENGQITELYLLFGCWENSGDTTTDLLPEIQAAAAAGSGELAIMYSESVGQLLYPEWVVR